MAQHQQPTEGSDHAAPHNEATSRLCVKNIPKYLDEKRLKDHFSAKGQVTDVKILKTRDGHSRQMAFVGYRSIEDATAAIKYFQSTYIDTSKLSIEFARRYRAPTAAADASSAAAAAAAADKEHRPWSKYSVGSTKHQQLLQKQAAAAAAAAADGKADKSKQKKQKKGAAVAAGGSGGDEAAAAANDPKLTEFLQLMQPRNKAKIWSNDDVLPTGIAAAAAAAAGVAPGADDEGDELYVDLPNGKPAAAAAAATEQSESADEDTDDDATDPLASKDAVVVDEGISDLDYLKARMKSAGQQQQQQPGFSGSSDDEDDDAAVAAAAADGSSDESDSEDDDGNHDQKAGSSDQISSQSADDVDILDLNQQQQQWDGPAAAAAAAADRDDHDHDHMDHDGDEFDAAARGDQAGVGPSAAAAAAAGSAAEAEILATGRLFVRNLAYAAGEAELSELFGGFGTLEEVHVVLDRDTRRSKGIAYIKYLLPEDAVAAYRALDMNPFQGRLLHVLPARKKPGDNEAAAAAAAAEQQQQEEGGAGGVGGSSSSSFKAQRDAQRRSDAGNRAAWSSLFMRPDTVAAAVAAHYGVSKSQLLDATASDLPLRMALGEVQVIAQTKAALADAGINVAALEAAAAAAGAAAAKKSVARSPTSLLVKNLPYSADEDELRQLFSGLGRTVVRLVLPPTKTLALVEFAEPQEARSAFKSLAYKKYQQVPLFLEWAPKDVWDTPPPAAATAAAGDKPATKAVAQIEAAANEQHTAAAVSASAAGGGGEAEDEGAEQSVGWVYVKNLNFLTTDAALKKHFDKTVSAAGGVIHSAKVARRKGADGKVLSMGFGFVETDSEAAAKAAIQALQGSMLDKHKLQVQLSKHGASGTSPAAAAAAKKSGKAAATSASGKEAGMKLVVRNVAFEATRKDLLGLFGPFGHIKSCRLPKKFDGNHRGFAFLEFTTKQEAANALEGVGGTHLYGRRLVVEYAQPDDEGQGLDELRAKTAARFAGDEQVEEAPAPKRLKKNL